MRQTLAGLSLACSVSWTACHAQQATVPFVGCPSNGQAGFIAPPTGQPKSARLGQLPAGAIADYKGDQAPGVFAPAGWHCRVWYGSSGSTLIVTPAPIDTTHFPKVVGPAVEMSVSAGGTSGRFAVARYASRLFPGLLSRFIQRVKDEHLEPDSEFSPGRHGRDSLTRVGRLMATFTTPPGVAGLGTAGALGPSGDPVQGVAAITADSTEPDMVIVRVRLGTNMRRAEAAVLRLNRQCIQDPDGC